jgi:hypothetical protein
LIYPLKIIIIESGKIVSVYYDVTNAKQTKKTYVRVASKIANERRIIFFECRATLYCTALNDGPPIAFLFFFLLLVAHTCDLFKCEFVNGENGSVDRKCSDERDTQSTK